MLPFLPMCNINGENTKIVYKSIKYPVLLKKILADKLKYGVRFLTRGSCIAIYAHVQLNLIKIILKGHVTRHHTDIQLM